MVLAVLASSPAVLRAGNSPGAVLAILGKPAERGLSATSERADDRIESTVLWAPAENDAVRWFRDGPAREAWNVHCNGAGQAE